MKAENALLREEKDILLSEKKEAETTVRKKEKEMKTMLQSDDSRDKFLMESEIEELKGKVRRLEKEKGELLEKFGEEKRRFNNIIGDVMVRQ